MKAPRLSDLAAKEIRPGLVVRLGPGDDNCGPFYVGKVGIIYAEQSLDRTWRWVTADIHGNMQSGFKTYQRKDYEVLGYVPVDGLSSSAVPAQWFWERYGGALKAGHPPMGMTPYVSTGTPTITYDLTKESGMNLSISITVGETIDGWIGQVRDCNGKIIWQSEPQTEEKDESGKVVKNGSQVATEVTQDKVTAVLKGLFA